MSLSPSSEPPSPLSPPESPAESPAETDASSHAQSLPASQAPFPNFPTRTIPGLRGAPDASASSGMTRSSTPLGSINAARRPPGVTTGSSSQLPSSMQAKMRAFHLSRQGAPPPSTPDGGFSPASPNSPRGPLPGGIPSGPFMGGLASPGGFQLPPNIRPSPFNSASSPIVPKMPTKGSGGLAAKRGMGAGLKLSDASGPPSSAPGAGGSDATGAAATAGANRPMENAFSKYSEYIDTATGTLRFKGKATLHGSGVEFSGGGTFNISLDEVDTIDELGKGNYGTVYQVRHSRPRMRRPGMGLASNKTHGIAPASHSNSDANTTGTVMAMKEIRLELDDAKFAAIIMELDVLHRCISPFIIDFYGAFFQEGAVYICMEFMDGGSIDKLYADGMPEGVLRKVALSTVMGLRALKDEHNIIHRDVKPTNILVNQRGQIKICDFGVSGNLVASIAKTNIGCQSYMAPERISNGGMSQAGASSAGGTYSVQSDIWSLGLTLIECALGRYPYPPETYNNIFSQLSAIVDGDPPDLPESGYSDLARDFVRSCLHKIPMQRPTYAALMRHPWLAPLLQPPAIEEDSEAEAAAEAAAASESSDASGGAPVSTTPAPAKFGGLARAASGLAAAAQAAALRSPTSSTAPPVADAAATATAAAASSAAVSASSAGDSPRPAILIDTADDEVAAWVKQAVEKRRSGRDKAQTQSQRPALHTVDLGAVATSPAATGAAGPSPADDR